MSEIRATAERRGDEQMAAGAKKLSSFGWFGLSDSSKNEEAAEFFSAAGAQYKIAQAWTKAGEAFTKAARIHLDKLKNRTDGIQCLTEAGRAYRHTQSISSVKSLTEATRMLMDDNRFAPAAKLWSEIAEIENTENLDRKAAYAAFMNAADAYKAANSAVTAQSMKIKAAEMISLEEDFDKAADIYEAVAFEQSDNPAIAWSVASHLYRALLCRMATEAVKNEPTLQTTRTKLDTFRDEFARFRDGKEAQFIMDIANAYDERDVDAFTGVVHKYNMISSLDNWSQTILWKIKKTVSGGVEQNLADINLEGGPAQDVADELA